MHCTHNAFAHTHTLIVITQTNSVALPFLIQCIKIGLFIFKFISHTIKRYLTLHTHTQRQFCWFISTSWSHLACFSFGAPLYYVHIEYRRSEPDELSKFNDDDDDDDEKKYASVCRKPNQWLDCSMWEKVITIVYVVIAIESSAIWAFCLIYALGSVKSIGPTEQKYQNQIKKNDW